MKKKPKAKTAEKSILSKKARKPVSAGTSSFRQPSKAGAVKASGADASKRIDQRIRDLGDWRGETLARMRALILEADPDITEEWKSRPKPRRRSTTTWASTRGGAPPSTSSSRSRSRCSDPTAS